MCRRSPAGKSGAASTTPRQPSCRRRREARSIASMPWRTRGTVSTTSSVGYSVARTGSGRTTENDECRANLASNGLSKLGRMDLAGHALDGRLAGDLRDVVHPVVLAQRQQPLGLRGERADLGLGLRLAQVDPVLVATRADLGALRGVGGVHGRGERRVEFRCQPVQFGHPGAARLRLPQRDVRRARRGEQLAALSGRGDIRRVLVRRLLASLVHPYSVLCTGPCSRLVVPTGRKITPAPRLRAW